MKRGDGGAVEVVTGGEAMVLLLAAGDLPLASASEFQALIAGAESNVAIGLARLGHRVAFFGRVGADVFGERIRRELRGEGVDVSELRTDSERPTGLLFRDSVVGSPITVHYRRAGSAATAMTPDDVPTTLIAGARALHVTGITAALSEDAHAAVVAAMRQARSAGALVTFDPNVRLRLAPPARWAQLVDTLSREADVVLTGTDEAEHFAAGADPVAWLGERGVSTVVLKHGAAGASEHDLRSGEGEIARQPARRVPLVDPVGAGDAFVAGWLSGWLQGLPAEDRLREGCAIASLVVASRGDSTGLPDGSVRDRVLAEGADVDR